MASFSSYVQDKLYNELFSCAKRFLQENGNKFDFCSSLHRAGYSHLEDISVRHTKVEDLPGCRIKFYVYLELEVVTQEGSSRYDDYQDENIWLLVTCEGDIGDELENVSIVGIEDYTTKPKPNNPMDDALVPVFGKKDLDKHAEEFLRRNYPKALLEPISVEPDKLCEKMGLTIKRARISEDGNVFGRVYFYDGTVDVFDDDTGEIHTEDVKAGTILVDTTASFLYGIGAFNNTIVHECIHWDIHKKAVAFARMYNKGITSIGCKIVGGSIEKKFDFIEWQANNLAPRVQLPATMVKKYVDGRISYIRRKIGLYDYVDIIEMLIKDVATHFAVSQTAAKIRLIDLGYEEAKGALIYLDGHYVRPHKSASFALENHQTFSISARDAAWLRAFPGTGLKAILDEGRYIFVENHYVLNSERYVERNAENQLQLTHYALNHMDECCLVIDLTIDGSRVSINYHKECFLNRGFESTIDFKPEFHGGHAKKETQDKALEEFVLKTNEFLLTLPNDYVKSLEMAIDWVGNPSHAEIENVDLDGVMHGVSRKTLERCLAGETIKLQSMIAICISLKLPYKISRHIIDNSPRKLNLRENSHQWYDFVLETMYTSDVLQVNDFLRQHIKEEELL